MSKQERPTEIAVTETMFLTGAFAAFATDNDTAKLLLIGGMMSTSTASILKGYSDAKYGKQDDLLLQESQNESKSFCRKFLSNVYNPFAKLTTLTLVVLEGGTKWGLEVGLGAFTFILGDRARIEWQKDKKMSAVGYGLASLSTGSAFVGETQDNDLWRTASLWAGCGSCAVVAVDRVASYFSAAPGSK